MPVAQIDAHPGCEPKFQSRSTEPTSLPRKIANYLGEKSRGL